MRVRYIEHVKQGTPNWDKMSGVNYNRASSIYMLFGPMKFKSLSKNVAYKERIKSNNRLSMSYVNEECDKKDNNKFKKRMFRMGTVGEDEIMDRLFSKRIKPYYYTKKSYYEIEILNNNKVLRIGVSPDVVLNLNIDDVYNTIAIEMKTRCVGDDWWDVPSKPSIYQNAIQSIACKTDKGVIMRLNYNRNNHRNVCNVQVFKIRYDKNLKSMLADTIREFNNEPSIKTPEYFIDEDFYKIEEYKYFEIKTKKFLETENIADIYRFICLGWK